MSETVRRPGRTGYLLLLPAVLWLALFFVIPFYSLVATSLYDPAGSVFRGYDMTWAFSNYTDAIAEYWEPILRSLWYGAIATLICLVLGYVLAYAIAFKSGRWKNLMLVLVIAPFFTSFLVRTLSWKLILADDGFIVETLQFLHILGERIIHKLLLRRSVALALAHVPRSVFCFRRRCRPLEWSLPYRPPCSVEGPCAHGGPCSRRPETSSRQAGSGSPRRARMMSAVPRNASRTIAAMP